MDAAEEAHVRPSVPSAYAMASGVLTLLRADALQLLPPWLLHA